MVVPIIVSNGGSNGGGGGEFPVSGIDAQLPPDIEKSYMKIIIINYLIVIMKV